MNNIPTHSALSLSASIPASALAEMGQGGSSEASAEELQKVGQDFESIFISLMLKEMRNTISSEEGGGLFSGEGSDTYGGLFDMFMGQHLSQSAPLGISEAIESYLKNQSS